MLRRHPKTGARHLDALCWGLVPAWAKDISGAARMINARAETLAEKPAYRAAFGKRRCIIPADGFYEWQVNGKAKQPFAVTMADAAPMPLAGLWEGFRAADGSIYRGFTIITVPATPRLAALHERMPAILPPSAWAAWLGEDPASPAELHALLQPLEGSALRVWPVAPRVGKVSEDDAALLQRDPLAMVAPALDDVPEPAQSSR